MPLSPDAPSLLAGQRRAALAVPLGVFLIFGLLFGRQLLRLAADGEAVVQGQHTLEAARQTQLQIVDQELGARAYPLGHDVRLLALFDRATPRASFERLGHLAAEDPAKSARIAAVRQIYEDWAAAVSPTLQGGETSAAAAPRELARMESVRGGMGEIVEETSAQLRAREASLAGTATRTQQLFWGLVVASAALLAWWSRRQITTLTDASQATLEGHRQARELLAGEEWLRASHARLAAVLQGERTLDQLGTDTLAVLATAVGSEIGAFFTKEGSGWQRRAGYGLDTRAAGPASFPAGEGLVGQVAVEGELRHLREVPPDQLRVRAGTTEVSPVELVLLPACLEEVTYAVVELGFLRAPDARTVELLGRVGQTIAFAVRSAEYKQELQRLLEESEQQGEELQAQQEELRVANEELESQTNSLRLSQHQLEQQQAELEQTNDHLSQQSQLLEQRNRRLAETQAEIAAKALEVERASQFKSDFLSNMSHELRTPLNSSLILSKLLSDNRDGNLTEEQVKCAATIYAAGNDLLALINDILDLSKIEAGKLDVHAAAVPLDRIRATLQRTFDPVARAKGVRFVVTVDPTAPAAFETDAQRLEQILKNLVSNALKFTSEGEVSVAIRAADDRLWFAVHDTGIGILAEHQQIIFEAFRQADGATNRKYGGTGLGLSISRELARLLGGDLAVSSEMGQGSTFTLSLPPRYTGPLPASPPPLRAPPVAARLLPSPPVAAPAPHARDRAPGLPPAPAPAPGEPGQRCLLVIEDDAIFAGILGDVAREAGFDCLVAGSARQGIHLARTHLPAGIVLDLGLPDHTGLSVLDRLKRDPTTRHIPVHIISARDEVEQALAMGAAAYLHKPVAREQLVEAMRSIEARSSHRLRRVLVVDDDQTLRESVTSLLRREDVEICMAASVDEALALLRESTFDCLITDIGFPQQSGYELLETLASGEPYSVPPIIVYTGRDLLPDEEQALRKHSRSIIVKGAHSPERLLDEVTLFLHQVEVDLPPDQQRLLQKARHREALFEGKTILVVEDDVRNVFALTNVLEPKGARVVIGRNGKEALAVLEKETQVDLVLMDVMMPEMDGLEATRRIRLDPRRTRLPIIALTAKAMPDDQQRCLDAGASDYLAKPLDVEMLLSLLRVWMPRTR